jgi:hypothetical protein
MSEKKAFNITPARQVILNGLRNGGLKWSALRVVYFGENRAKGGASTAFHMQLTKMIENGLVLKDAATALYSLTDAGTQAIIDLEGKGVDLSLAVTNASKNEPTIKVKAPKAAATTVEVPA